MSMDKNKDQCEICKKKYGVFASEHQCKRCLRSVCRECANKKRLMFTKASTKVQEHRCCDICWPESESIEEYIKLQSLSFNCLSKQGKQWCQLVGVDDKGQAKPRQRPLNSKIQCPSFQDTWPLMTPSLRQICGVLVQKLHQSSLDNIIRNIYDKLIIRSNNDLTVHLVIFLLCHCDEKSVIKISNYLLSISKKVNQDIILKNVEAINQSQKMGPLASKQFKNLLAFAKSNYRFLTISLFANYFTIQSIHFIVSQTLLTGESSLLETIASCVICESEQQALSSKYEQKWYRNICWQTITLKGLQKSIKKLRKIKKITTDLQLLPKVSRSNAQIKQQNLATTIKELQIQSVEQKMLVKQEFVKEAIQEEIISKLNDAVKFLDKIGQKSDLNQDQMTGMESLDKYLDLILQENDKNLKEFNDLEQMLAGVEHKLSGKE